MAQISNCYLEYHSEFITLITLITLWRPQAVCSNCVMLQVNMDLKVESMLPRIKAVLEVKVQNSTRKEYLSECMLSCSCRITFFFFKYQGANLQCAGWIFFLWKEHQGLKEFVLVPPNCLPMSCCFLGNGTIFREKISRDIFMPFLGYKKCDLKKKTLKTSHNIYPINSTVVSHVVCALILCESSKAGSPITILSVTHDIVSRQRHRIWEKKTKRRIVIKMGFMQVLRVLSFDHHQELNQLHE